MADLMAFAFECRNLDQCFFCLDLFGASGRVAATWGKHGFPAIGFDIKLSQQDDIVSMLGFKRLITMAMQSLFCK